jgi:hypothetical protein
VVPEFRDAGGAMAARILAGRYEVQMAILDALHCAFHDSGLWRIALVIRNGRHLTTAASAV